MGFHEITSDTYRLGRSTVLGNSYAGVHIDADADSGIAAVTLMRLRNRSGRFMPQRRRATAAGGLEQQKVQEKDALTFKVSDLIL
ncbi:hypothetical protein JNB_12059 [Janibacter sp. HTCC2649]|uniref:hypothetical protein n=1 Tax=Janibacter sp. HTCC2649 TaxID=313589 RepID=UPI0000670B81|nr:hypothetical protein [Janibacter sp. HTCC2649]EAQ00909.1 hypothetical protein JNB_12059 [Janibacter sp. HTCC2649]